ncbi:MAG: lytic murein transglycosylase [Rhodobacteraceae bacterium]|nr:lytic murein transglycosylase [Paracoccaceae bacterium]
MDCFRRRVMLSLTAAMLAGCTTATSPRAPARRRNSAGAGTDTATVANPAFDEWLTAFRARAAAHGIGADTLGAAFRGAGYLPVVIERDQNQFQYRRTVEDYIAIATSQERLATGRAMLQLHAKTLAAIEARFGVAPHVVAAIWGVESRYGERRGEFPVISALATLGFASRRAGFFESQLLAALRILQRGDISARKMTGSWAGAMGHTQFIPTTYESFAVDFDGDGRRDIWADDPTDALASAAAYIKRSGWQSGRLWGVEVMLPQGFNTALAGRGTARSIADWAALGARAAHGALPDHGPASLVLPGDGTGPAFLAFRNFTVLTRYNNSDKYVIAVGHLSDRLRGGPALRGGFAPDASGMTLTDRKALQRKLTAAGFDTGSIDGVIGSKTHEAIRAYQARHGLQVTGEPSLALLRRLG